MRWSSPRLPIKLLNSHGFEFYSTGAARSAASLAHKSDAIRSSGFSSAAIDAAVVRVRDVSDVARHYGRCYWELSKARLRFGL